MRASLKILVNGVSKWFESNHTKIQAIGNVSFEVEKGAFVSILGPSGCGKSTILNMIAGLEPCNNGEIKVDEENISQPERHRMMLFQEAALFPWFNVLGNVIYGLKMKKGLSNQERNKVALHYLKMVGLEKFANSRIHELSGGMKQRVALARALAPNPNILLMDEPFGALDALTCEQLYDDVQKIWQARRKTILLVTHNIREAITLSQKIIVLSSHPGRVIKEFNVDLPYPRSIHDPCITEIAEPIIQSLRANDISKGRFL